MTGRAYVNGTIVLDGELFELLMANTTSARLLREALIRDLSKALSLPPSLISIVRLAVGSLIADFTVNAGSVAEAESITAAVRNLPNNDDVVMTATSNEYRKVNPSSGDLGVSRSSAQTVTVDDGGDDSTVEDTSGAFVDSGTVMVVAVGAAVAAALALM
jgi:hypothetical protein